MSRQQSFDKVDLLGVSVDVITLNEAINFICAAAADRSKPAAYIVKPYVEFFDRAARNSDIKELLNSAELSLADGVAVLWAAHFLYAGPRNLQRFLLSLLQIITAPGNLTWPVPERAAGTTFTWPLLRSAAANNLRVYLIGKETNAAITAVAAEISRQVPGISIAGTLCGRDPLMPAGEVSEAWISQTISSLQTAQPDLVLVGMGFPLQERLCARFIERLPHGIFIGEGGTFDYESFGGQRRKAPGFIQRIGLEWLWRLAQEPHRIIRQLAIPRFIYRIWKSR